MQATAEKRVTVRFLRRCAVRTGPMYNAGELASFPESVAQELIEFGTQ